jgi:hypothetical protein
MVGAGLPRWGSQLPRVPERRGTVEPQFEVGEVILYRRVRDGHVMLAAPLRVVEDTPQRIVLYQAPDTAFKSARTADGGRA